MKICLAIESSTGTPSVALVIDNQQADSESWDGSRGSSTRMARAIQNLLLRNRLTPADITLYGVGLGPGNFTGLRTSLAAIQAMALPEHTPVIGIASAAACAATAFGKAQRIAVIGDARRNRAWCGIFDCSGDFPELSGDFQLLALEDLPQHITQGDLMVTPDANLITDDMAAALDTCGATLAAKPSIPNAATIAEIALYRWEHNLPSLPLQPIYIHPPVFVEPRFTKPPQID